MSRSESINVRVTPEEKNNLGARTVEAGLFSISEYIRQVLFVHSIGLDLRQELAEAINEMKAQGENTKGDLQAARETIEAGVLKMTEERKAGNAEIIRALKTFMATCQDTRQDRRQQKGKYIADPWLYPFGVCIAFMFGVVIF